MEFADRGASFASWLKGAPRHYATTLGVVTAAALLYHWLEVAMGVARPLTVFYPAIILVALLGGFGPGLFATLLSAAIAYYFLLDAMHSFVGRTPRDIVSLLLFALTGTLMSAVAGSLRWRGQKLQEFEKAVEGVEEMVVVLDRDQRHLIANRTLLMNWGVTRKQVIGVRVSEIVTPEIFQTLQGKLEECFRGNIVQFEMSCESPKLGPRDLMVSYYPIEERSGGVSRVAAIIKDVTDTKRTEAALRHREEGYRQFVAQSSEGIFREELDAPLPVDLPEDEMVRHIDRHTYMAECNDAIARMYGFESGSELVGKRRTEMLVAGDSCNTDLTREYIRSGFRLLDHETHAVDIHGNPKIFRKSLIGIVENGKLVRTWGIQRDATEQVKIEQARTIAEAALRKSEEHFRILVEQASDGIFFADAQGRY